MPTRLWSQKQTKRKDQWRAIINWPLFMGALPRLNTNTPPIAKALSHLYTRIVHRITQEDLQGNMVTPSKQTSYL